MSGEHNCPYCGTRLDPEGNEIVDGRYHTQGGCLEYVKAASNAKDVEIARLRGEWKPDPVPAGSRRLMDRDDEYDAMTKEIARLNGEVSRLTAALNQVKEIIDLTVRSCS